MSFRFRYQALLQHREYLNKKAQTALAVAQQNYETAESNRNRLLEEIEQVRKLWEQKQASGIHVGDYLSFREYLTSLEQHLLTLNKALDHALNELERARQLVIEKEKEVKMLETLKEHEKEIHRFLETKKEQKQLDQIAVIKDYENKTHTK